MICAFCILDYSSYPNLKYCTRCTAKLVNKSSEVLHIIARQPLPTFNVVMPKYLRAGNKVFRESINRMSNE